MRPYYVCWYMTEQCNLSCPFCYAFKGRQDLSKEMLLSVGEALVSQGIKKINLMGGEPLLQPHLSEVIDRLWSLADLSITTNGTLLGSEAIAHFANRLERLTISLDTTSPRVGRMMRGPRYRVSDVLNSVQEAARSGMSVKINTVVTTHNIHALHDLGRFLMQLDGTVCWKLHEVTDNQNVRCDLGTVKPSLDVLEKTIVGLRDAFPAMQIDFADSVELNTNYLIVRANGDLHVPFLKGYRHIANALHSDFEAALSHSAFDFTGNERIYDERSPGVQFARSQSEATGGRRCDVCSPFYE